jgi:hypothetical protein
MDPWSRQRKHLASRTAICMAVSVIRHRLDIIIIIIILYYTILYHIILIILYYIILYYIILYHIILIIKVVYFNSVA